MRKSRHFFGVLFFALLGTLLFPARSEAQTSAGTTAPTKYHAVHVYKFTLGPGYSPESTKALVNDVKASEGILEVTFDESTNTLITTTKKQVAPMQIKAIIVGRNMEYSRFTEEYIY